MDPTQASIDQSFSPGQRWISHTESELGLGLIERVEDRRVYVRFPAVSESRVYALVNSPLTRVHYPVGERIRGEDGLSLIVESHRMERGCLIYEGVDEQGQRQCLPEQCLESAAQFNKPEERLFSGQMDSMTRFNLRQETLRHWFHQQQSSAFGLLGPRVQLLPHQFYIADQVAKRHAPRVMLADEVGLGKTIEAGLIAHQLLHVGRASRILIVVPEPLLHQWLVEMLRRFNLRFTLLDESRYDDLKGSSDSNPFESAQLVLCATRFLSSDLDKRAQAIEAQWDLLIVDEAHHLEWNDGVGSDSYQCIEALTAEIPGLLLLTATPEQLGIAGHFARLRLLDPDRFHDFAAFEQEQAHYQEVGHLAREVLDREDLQAVHKDSRLNPQLNTWLGEDWMQQVTEMIKDDASPKEALLQTLLDRHGTGRVLFRNTREAVAGFPQRKLHTYSLAVPDPLVHEQPAVIESQLQPERLLGDIWLEEDTRIAWLLDWVQSHRSEKVLLICSTADTAIELEALIRMKTAIRTALFHEALSLVARDRAAAYFADPEAGAQILLCSEIGSEGRNFQFAHHLLMFDLPLNPDLLEQRIGRLDRIGQTETVNIHVPYYEEGPQSMLMRWFHEGLDAFEAVCPMGAAIYAEQADALRTCMQASEDDAAFEALLAETRLRRQQMAQEMHEGRDFLLELNSCRPKAADALVHQVAEAARTLELSGYMERVFDQYGVEQQYHSQDCVVIKPTEHMLQSQFPGLPEDGLTATYRRGLALEREDLTFLSWEHPLVAGAMDMVLSEGFGNATFCTLALPPLDSGLLILEAYFELSCPAPKYLQLDRYLNHDSKRVVICSNGMDLTHILKPEHIETRAERVKKGVALNVVQHGRPSIQKLVDQARRMATEREDEVVAQSLAAVTRDIQAEKDRLKALARVNPMIRGEEIKQLESREQEAHHFLALAGLRLDAVRVMLTV